MRAVAVLFFVILSVAGCQTFEESVGGEEASWRSDPELQGWYREYVDFDEEKFVASHEKELVAFERDYEQWRKTKVGKEFLNSFPWLNPDKLSQKDKAFIVKVGQDFVRGMLAAYGSPSSYYTL